MKVLGKEKGLIEAKEGIRGLLTTANRVKFYTKRATIRSPVIE